MENIGSLQFFLPSALLVAFPADSLAALEGVGAPQAVAGFPALATLSEALAVFLRAIGFFAVAAFPRLLKLH